MTVTADWEVKGATVPIKLRPGVTTILVGANGTGKSRLAKACEDKFGAEAHRISAQRMLVFDPSVERIRESDARNELYYGYKDTRSYGDFKQARDINRWGNNSYRHILNDSEALLKLLLANQATLSVKVNNDLYEGLKTSAAKTILMKLSSIFNNIIPDKKLVSSSDEIEVVSILSGNKYSISDMSDGEKSIFYMVGQVLTAPNESILIMDEPEIHVHRSILSRLWDELEAARPDCTFLLITHDLEFAASRTGTKYVIRSYNPRDGWDIEEVPEAIGFSEDLVTLILGSRKPILFVEGEQGSLDQAFYRACYPDWTVIPRGPRESVIHSVKTLNDNSSFTRIVCHGVVDSDGQEEADIQRLQKLGVQPLPVSEIENLLLLPKVSRTILEIENYNSEDLEKKLECLKNAVFADASHPKNIDEVVIRHCRRKIDRQFKYFDFSSAKSLGNLITLYKDVAKMFDIEKFCEDTKNLLQKYIDTGDLVGLLSIYDRKGALLNIAAFHLRKSKVDDFCAWVTRTIGSTTEDRLRNAIAAVLPALPVD